MQESVADRLGGDEANILGECSGLPCDDESVPCEESNLNFRRREDSLERGLASESASEGCELVSSSVGDLGEV